MSFPQRSVAGLNRFLPLPFVLLWSTGWLAARFAAFEADALTFLSWRFALSGLLLAGVATIAGARWPANPLQWLHALVAGVLLHGLYLGCIWWAVRAGLPASISGLLAALQPMLTAGLAPVLIGERVSAAQRGGIACGFLGLAIVLGPGLLGARDVPLWPAAVNTFGMLSVTLGTFYQKRFQASGDLLAMTAVQYAGGLAVVLVGAMAFEPMRIAWSATLLATMAWSVMGLSIGAILLMLIMIRRGAVARMAALIFLVPPAVAVESYFLFGDRLTPTQMGGIVLTVAGVALATRR